MGRVLPWSPLPLDFRLPTSKLGDARFCCFEPPVCGTLSRQPGDTATGTGVSLLGTRSEGHELLARSCQHPRPVCRSVGPVRLECREGWHFLHPSAQALRVGANDDGGVKSGARGQGRSHPRVAHASCEHPLCAKVTTMIDPVVYPFTHGPKSQSSLI